MSRSNALNFTIEPGNDTLPMAVIKTLLDNGWTFHKNGKAHYVPLNDNDAFKWQENYISQERIFDLIGDKIKNKEIPCITLYDNDSDVGFSLLIEGYNRFCASLIINPKYIDKSKYLLDCNWYSSKILLPISSEFFIFSYEFAFVY